MLAQQRQVRILAELRRSGAVRVADLTELLGVSDMTVRRDLEQLAAEGLARDLVRQVQQTRRDAGLDVSDRIALTIGGSPEVVAAVTTHRDLIAGETLATSYDVVAADGPEPTVTVVKA